jgi:hypothetical protein
MPQGPWTLFMNSIAQPKQHKGMYLECRMAGLLKPLAKEM